MNSAKCKESKRGCLKTYVFVLIAMAASPVPLSTCEADIVTVVASADGHIVSNGSVVDTATVAIAEDSLASGFPTNRAIFEFDLGVIPTGAVIESVEFSGFTQSAQNLDSPGNASVVLSSYLDPSTTAQLTVDDFNRIATSQNALLEQFGQIVTGQPFSSTFLSLTDAQAAADTGQVLGVRARHFNSSSRWQVRTVESTLGGPPPTLTISYSTIPEPGAVSVLTLGSVFLAVRRRRTVGN
ncbi:MAG: hypothetical protein AAF456_05125 [Planctomycetota bacterium]